MKIVYLSDLHLEINDYGELDLRKWAKGDVLVIAGDLIPAAFLKNKKNFAPIKALEWLKEDIFPSYELVILIMGNHDHYHGIYGQTYGLLKTYFQDTPNVRLLENEALEYKGVLFLGCTLWTDFCHNSPIEKMAAEAGMADYRCIKEQPGKFIRADFLYEMNRVSLAALRQHLTLNPSKPTIVITHHAPTYVSVDPRHSGSGLTYAFASDFSDLILEHPQLCAWIHGHTHDNCAYAVGNCWVVANQLGYRMERCYTQFHPNHFLEFKDGICTPKIESQNLLELEPIFLPQNSNPKTLWVPPTS